MDIRSMQQPLKERYRSDGTAAQITLTARASLKETPIACSVDIGRAILAAEAHSGVGGSGLGACSGDLLLGALAACAQITCQMVPAAMGLRIEDLHVLVEGRLDLRGTLGLSREVPVGFSDIRLTFEIDAPEASPSELESLLQKTERYCVVLQSLQNAPRIQTSIRLQTPKSLNAA